MPQIVKIGKELICVNPSRNTIDYSTSEGRTWTMRYNNNSNFDFLGLAESGSTLLATTSKGLYYSNSQGRTWLKR